MAVLAHAAPAADCAAVSTPDQKPDADTIQRIEQGWLAAEYRGNRAFLDCLLEDDYRVSSRSGQVRTREEVIGRVSAASDPSRPVPALRTVVLVHGASAVAHSFMTVTDKDGHPKEVHYVDGYTFHDGRWYAYGGTDL